MTEPHNIQAFYDRQYSASSEILRTSKTYTVEFVPNAANCRRLDILDVGCGSGAMSKLLAEKGHRVHGVDISATAISHYRQLGFPGDARNIEQDGLGHPDASFDAVFCSEVIEHMTSPEFLAAEMYRVLKPNGLLVLSTPNSAFWLYRLLGLVGYTVSELQHPKHFQFFSRRSLLRILTGAKFELEKISGRNMYLILPDTPEFLHRVLAILGFTKEKRFRTGGHFWHLSHQSSVLNSFFADTLIVAMRKLSC